MAQIIKLRRSNIAGKQPTTSQLALGELGLNVYDGKVYLHRSGLDDTIQSIFTTNAIITGSLQQSGSDSYFLSNVGIGTSSPGEKLEVYGNGTDSTVKIHEDAGSATASLHLRSGWRDYHLQLFQNSEMNFIGGSGDTTNVRFSDAGTEMLFLSASGDVGIGTTTPTQTLDVSGSISILSGSTNQLLLPLNNDASNPTIAFGDGNTGFYEIIDNRLGVTIAGTSRFFFESSKFRGSIVGGPQLRNEDATNTNPVYVFTDDDDTGIGSSGADNLSLIAGGVEQLRIASNKISGSATSTGSFGAGYFDGKVGIGTTSPEYQLHIAHPNTRGTIRIENSTQGGEYFEIANSDAHCYVNFNEGSGDAAAGRGIIHFQVNAAEEAGAFDGNAGGFKFEGPSQTFMRIFTKNRSVGIGNFNYAKPPSAKLHVSASGNQATGSLFKVTSTTEILNVTSTKISGSAISTGSFGQLHLMQKSWSLNPTLNFGDGDTGVYEEADDQLTWAIGGSDNFVFVSGYIAARTTTGRFHIKTTSGEDSSTVPIYTFKGDTNTGYGRPAADNLSLIAGGVEQLRIASNKISGSATSTGSFGDGRFANKVGIGTDSPAGLLEVDGIGGQSVIIGANTSDQKQAISFYGASSGTYLGWSGNSLYYTSNGTGGDHVFQIAVGTELMRVTGDGKVGIGTASPSSVLTIGDGSDGEINGLLIDGSANRKVELDCGGSYLFYRDNVTVAINRHSVWYSGELLFCEGGSNSQLWKFGIAGSSNDLNIQDTSDNTLLYLEQGGNVGIGTTSPGSKFTIQSSGGSWAEGLEIRRDATSFSQLINDGIGFGLTDSKGIVRFVDVDVVIGGDNSPDATLEVIKRGSTDLFMLNSAIDNDGDLFIVKNDGKVGIGTTSPSKLLHVAGDAQIDGTLTAQEFHTEFVSASIVFSSGSTKFGDTGDDEHQFTGSLQLSGSVGNESYIIGTNFGIGTTNPTEELHVDGTIKITGDSKIEFRDADVFFDYDNPGGNEFLQSYSRGVHWKTNDNFGTSVFDWAFGSRKVMEISSSASTGLLNIRDSIISGSATSTGSFGIVTTNKITKSNPNPRDVIEFGNYSRTYINKNSDSIDAGLSIYNPNSAVNDAGLSVYQGDSDAPAIVTSGNNASISGSSTSTGSFGDGRFANKVGIGTSSPTQNLVVNSSGTTSLLISSLNSGIGLTRLLFGEPVSGDYIGQVSYDHSDDSMTFIAGGVEQLRIASNKISGSATSTGSFGTVQATYDINTTSGRVYEQGNSVIDHATAMAIVFGG
ncbi:hypothetical protein HX837_05585 [Marine Group I thaumarchaeote]|uniref:Uncharacterized protein n=1 Tax=Marine Group I thaumarchaeote TaxID=2511932 RepID=A0A7K4MQX7_9ARCH|nr:hypothetical protein [Marine Group I thaumarchaeote]